jgi:sortase A
MKKRLFTAGMFLVFIAGLAVMLYPYVASYVNSRVQSRDVTRYILEAGNITDEAAEALIDAAHRHNRMMRGGFVEFSDTELEAYYSMLRHGSGDVVGILEIDLIGVELPIYLGVETYTLQRGIGHMPGSSLPVGGEGTHAVLTGHRGLPSSVLLTNLDRMVVGDVFTVRVLNRELVYQVDQIIVTLPDDTGALAVVPGMDYCTLATCTPYGINSHRMLVRGVRVEDAEAARVSVILSEARKIHTGASLLVLLAVSAVITLFAKILCRLFRRVKKITLTFRKGRG